jgi:hypothetical protein
VTLSPRLDDEYIDKLADPYTPPVAHTEHEIRRMIQLASARNARSVIIGHGADAESTAAAREFAECWILHGGIILDTVRWPDRGASWLGHARIFTAVEPDLWIMGGAPAGLAQMIRRLVWSTNWKPSRTIGFASATSTTMLQLADTHNLEGLIGATTEGGIWGIVHHLYTELGPEEQE